LTKRNLFHEVFKLFHGASAITWIFCIDSRFDNFVAIGIEMADNAVSRERCSRAGMTAMAEIVKHERTLKEEVLEQKIR
jgi:hypothetical protein